MVGWIVLIIHVVSEWLGRKKHYSSITKYPQSKFAAYGGDEGLFITLRLCGMIVYPALRIHGTINASKFIPPEILHANACSTVDSRLQLTY